MPPFTAGPIWLQGPVAGVPDHLQHVAHALIECRNDVRDLLEGLPEARVWERSQEAASVGFHIRHSMGSLDRLFTYARGESLSAAQLEVLSAEKTMDGSGLTPQQLLADFSAAVDHAVEQLRQTPASSLLDVREVGRARMPSTVIGLLSHAADHTYRHVGQAITTAKLLG